MPPANSAANAVVHRTRPRNPAHAAKCRGHQQHAVMCLAARLRAGVAGMVRAVIDHTQQRGRKCLGQHGLQPCGARLHCRHIDRSPLSAKSQLPIPRPAAHNGTMTRRVSRTRAYAPDPAAPGRTCDMPGCEAMGEYRAPKSRRNLQRLLVVLPGARARLQLHLGLLQGHVAGRDRGAAPRRHRLAAPILAARPAGQGRGVGRGRAARPAASARRRPREARPRR